MVFKSMTSMTAPSVEPKDRAERERLVLLRTGEALARSTAEDDATARVAALLVPGMADWCFVDLLDGTFVRRSVIAHVDAAKVAEARAIGERFPMDPEARFGPVPAIRARASNLDEEIPLRVREGLPRECSLSRVVAQLGICSRVVVPLVSVRDSVVGALTIAWAEHARRYSSADLPLLEELGRRLGMTIEALRAQPGGTSPATERALLARLSPRERQVLELVAGGHSTRAIAERLGLGVRTVETHRVHVLRKLKLKGAVDVVRFAARVGLVSPA